MDKFKDWKDLSFRLNRFATGKYLHECPKCQGGYLGDKRASLCFECDLEEVKLKLKNTQTDIHEKINDMTRFVHNESKDDSIPIDEKAGVKLLKSAGILGTDNKLTDKYDFTIDLSNEEI